MSRANAWLSIELNGPSFPKLSSSKRHSQALKNMTSELFIRLMCPSSEAPVFFGGIVPGFCGALFHTVGMFLSFIVTCVPKKTVCPNRSPHRSSIFLEIRRVSYLLDPSWKTIAIVPIFEVFKKLWFKVDTFRSPPSICRDSKTLEKAGAFCNVRHGPRIHEVF